MSPSKLCPNGRHVGVHVRASPTRGASLREGREILHQGHHATPARDVLTEGRHCHTVQRYSAVHLYYISWEGKTWFVKYL